MRAAFLAPVVIAMLAGPASARMERCLLEVGGKPYIVGKCNVMREVDGTFSVGAGDDKHAASNYFAYLSKADDGSVTGVWNETPGSTHAATELGPLKRVGACFEAPNTRVCAWP